MRPDEAEIAAPWSAPLLKDILVVESQGEDLDVAALGVRVALLALLDNYTVPGWLPALLDEQRCPLSGPMSPTPSWCFKKDHGAVPIGVMHQYVLLLVERFRMTVGELVMAYACVERVLVLHPTTVRVNSIRPMLLGACVIASKTSRDGDIGLWEFQKELEDVLDINVPLLASIERQMLELLGWSLPMGRVYQKYADAIFKAASHRLGRWVAAPRVLHAFDDEPESVPVALQPPPAAYATEAASKSSYPPLPTSSSSPTSVRYNPSPTSFFKGFELDVIR